MQRITLLTIALILLPGVSFALEGLVPSSFFGGIPYVFAETMTVTNESSIQSETNSSASTGGNTVGPGGTVKTGNASASSQSSVHVGDGGGTVEVTVETEVDGVKSSESIKKNLKPGESVNITVATSSSSGLPAQAGGAKTSGSAGVKGGVGRDGEDGASGNASSSVSMSSSAPVPAGAMPLFRSILEVFEGTPLKNIVEGMSRAVWGLVNVFWFW